jgi:hypothetical protein
MIEHYVKSCINSDGGYSFTWGVDSNAQDTYFALATMGVLGIEIRREEETIAWLRSHPVNDIRSLYYVTLSLALLDEEPPECSYEILASFRLNQDSLYVGLSEFESLFMYSCLAKSLDRSVEAKGVPQYLLRFRSRDGGFGGANNSNIVATYHAVSALDNLGYDVDRLDSTKDFVRACESPQGGFDLVPGAHISYLEGTYAGIELLGIFGLRPRHPQECIRSIAGAFRFNGGFARTGIGIATLENTFYAASCLTKLEYF